MNENDINKDRILEPVPALQRSYQQKHGESLQHQQLQMVLASVLEYCHRRDASEASAIEALLKTRFDVGGTALTALGLGSAQKSVRRIGGTDGGYGTKKQHIFIASLNTGEPAAPIRIKPGEARRKKKGRYVQGVCDRDTHDARYGFPAPKVILILGTNDPK